MLLYEGKLVPGDKIAAYKWMLLAAESGTKDSKSLLREMEIFLNQSEVEDARKQAAKFKPVQVSHK
jgi:TPR repeat protein